jgi:hypothetical protein
MRRAALHALATFAVATVSFGAWAQGINASPPEDETAPSRDRERHDDPAVVPSADAGLDGDAAPSAAPSASAPAPPAAASSAAVAPAPPPAPSASAEPAEEPEHEPSELGFSFGIRASYATPFGAAIGGPLNQEMLGLFPVGLDVGWVYSPNLYFGAWGVYGFAVGVQPTSDTCTDPDETCSASYFGFGLTTEWHFRPHEFYDPWVGLEVGYEIINLDAGNEATQLQDQSGSLHGFDVAVRAGLDFKPKHYYGLGPFIELSTGHYARPPASDGVDPGSALSLHEWLGFGLRLHSGI